MRTRAEIETHLIHPSLVSLPLASFFLALVGDTLHASSGSVYWYRFALGCLGIGILTALFAAVFGVIDYVGISMSARGRRLATIHLAIIFSAVVLYALNFQLRIGDGALHNERWAPAYGLEILTFAGLIVAGWLGARLAPRGTLGAIDWTARERSTRHSVRQDA